ncbi:hypothetical protein [Blastococcus montanus]|uniref:hypothetical protein n=1 Tax=Blastococcus montanus TaxID=3144973 RepID=UPI0032080383
MDAATAAAWLVLGVALGVLAVIAAVAGGTAARRRDRTGGRSPGARDERVDDLADFLEHPPGSRPEAPPSATGWVALAPAPPAAPPPREESRRRASLPLAVACVAALVLVGTAAAVAAGSRSGTGVPRAAPGTPDPAAPAVDASLVADLAVGGLVLEPRAVGVTAAYPDLRLTADDGAARLELRLPTYNCLTADAPADPVAAGCAASLVEHATVEPADLRLDRDGDRLVLRGQAATWTRPAGSGAEPTGRVYEFELTVAPDGARAPDGSRCAVGELRLGGDSAPVLTDRSRIRGTG